MDEIQRMTVVPLVNDEASLADQNRRRQSLTWELPSERVQNWKVTVPPRGMPPAGVALLSRSSRRRVL